MKKLFHFVREYWQFSFALVAALVALVLEFNKLHVAAHWILSAASIAATVPLVWSMVQDLREGKYGVDILAAAAIITSVVMHQFWAGIVIVLMLTGGESLEDYAEHRAKKELDSLLTRAPQKARVLRGTREVEVRASEVVVDDKLVIRPGELVPVDAVILEGTSSLDESSLTGESLPQVKKVHDQLLSGSVNLDGVLTVRALHSAADSQYQQIIKLVRIASQSQAPFVRLADRYAVPFTIISFGIAGIAWAWSGQSLRFLQVLVVATPCPLILAAPIAIISGMSRAAKHGIIIKTGSALERLAQARTFAFDKTGTLTVGRPQVDSVKTYNGFKSSEVVTAAAAIEQQSNHVLARAIVARAKKATLPKAKQIQELAGNGLMGTIGGKRVVVGRLSLLEKYDIALPGGFDSANVQATAAFVAIDKQLAGVITFTDAVRDDAKRTLAELREAGVEHIMMVTGDNKATAKTVAKALGFQQFHAETLPGDKILAIESVKERPVAFVGDGVNDAPVLTASDVGIALGARGSTAASESADVVVMLDDLRHVAESRQIARRTFYIAKQSIFIGIGLSIVLMLIFATGRFQPVYGAAVQELVDVVVIFNALRAHGSARRQPSTK